MSATHPDKYLVGLVQKLCQLPSESEWVEFKQNKADPQEIGEYISALSNAAALNNEVQAYVIWGVENETHEIVGTRFCPANAKKGNEPLESWLLRLLQPKIQFRFYTVKIDGLQVVILKIDRANRNPVSFSGKEYIRIGEVKKPLIAAPDRERALWRIFDQRSFEDLVVVEHLTVEEVLSKLDYPKYFDLLELPLPVNHDRIIEALSNDRLIQVCPAGGWNITNLGAILLAKRLTDFRSLSRKVVRVIQYRGTGRTETVKEHQPSVKGYAASFEDLVSYINGLLPSTEIIGQALRRTVPTYPELAIRELVANALIHQDFFATGAGTMVEIFEDRIEITNPGKPLVSTERFLDTSPNSRNEVLASLMRRFQICEERGSGIDKVILEVESCKLPAPLFESSGEFTRTVLFAHKGLKEMGKLDRIRACYFHACLFYVARRRMTNATLRERFGIANQNAAIASRLIKEAREDGKIVLEDPYAGPRNRTYLPFWASSKVEDSAGIV